MQKYCWSEVTLFLVHSLHYCYVGVHSCLLVDPRLLFVTTFNLKTSWCETSLLHFVLDYFFLATLVWSRFGVPLASVLIRLSLLVQVLGRLLRFRFVRQVLLLGFEFVILEDFLYIVKKWYDAALASSRWSQGSRFLTPWLW